MSVPQKYDCQKIKFIIKVTENVINHQLERFAKTKGINPDQITLEERVTLMEDMIKEHYPGITE